MSLPFEQPDSFSPLIANLPLITAADFGPHLDPHTVRFTTFADTELRPNMRYQVRTLVECKLGCFPSLLYPFPAARYEEIVGIGRLPMHKQNRLDPPFATYVIDAPTKSGESQIFAVWGLMKHSLGFERQCDVVGRKISETDLDCDAFLDVPFFLWGILFSSYPKENYRNALDIALHALLAKATEISFPPRASKRVAMISTNYTFTRVLVETYGFEYSKPSFVTRSVLGRGKPINHYVIFKNLPA